MYKGICNKKGALVDECEALEYALRKIEQGTEEEKQEFIEWFYSGNWIKEEEE